MSNLTAVELGSKLDLFFQHEMSPGSIFWKPKGAELFNNLIRMMRVLYVEHGFTEVVSPNIADKELWKISGHWDKYREDMFILMQDRLVESGLDDNSSEYRIDTDKKLFSLKPMNCPLHCLIYKQHNPYSKDLPIRLAEFGVLHRNESSGSLHGLTRVRRFQQDDAHIFCKLDQIEAEVLSNLQMIKKVYDKFGLTFKCELSTRPEKFVGTEEMWDLAEKYLKQAIVKYTGRSKVKVKKGDGAFYGPKIDIALFDRAKRKIQCGTIQLDFNLPSAERFDLKYREEQDPSIIEHPVIVHRAVLGSLERFIGIVLEHTQGRLPLGISPYPISVITVKPNNEDAAKILEQYLSQNLRKYGIHAQIDTDYSSDDIRQKIKRKAKLGYCMVLTVGDREAESIHNANSGNFKGITLANAEVAVRSGKKVRNMSAKEIIAEFVTAYNNE